MSEGYEKSKLKKQLTVRKRGKEPSTAAAASQNEESKSVASTATRKSAGTPGYLGKFWKKNAPTYLQHRPSSKMAFDAAFFITSVIVVAKLGQTMNDMIAEFVPSEASLRQ